MKKRKEITAACPLLVSCLCPRDRNIKDVDGGFKSDIVSDQMKNTKGQSPLHEAVLKRNYDAVKAAIKEKADLDAVDNNGNTALHLAVTAQSPEIVTLLLKSGANFSIKNNEQMMPLHLAAELTNTKVMKTLLDHGADPNVPSQCGVTPLHLAAVQDNAEMMRLIISRGGKPGTKCDFGFYPIHVAAMSAAAGSLEAILEEGTRCGYTRQQILSFKDKENNLPLHSAVFGGNIKAVSVCLNAGAKVNTQQDDGSTPLHFACSQGNLDMIKLMNESQPTNFQKALHTVDIMKMTPLHRAALFNHKNIMEYLLDEDADIDARDIHDRTPLLLAASKGDWDIVQMLLVRGADIHVKDNNNRNFLHLAIKFRGKFKSIGGSFMNDIQMLLNERDDFGCTPLHYASKEGHLYALDDLIKLGAVLNLKDNHKQSPFHFAARYGRVNTCRRLLDSAHGPYLINDTDGDGLSALHIAAQNGHTKIIKLLLERGAVISKDNDDNSALHHAAAQGWTHCMRILLAVRESLRDVPNKDGDTALHVAAKNGRVSSVSLLLTLGAKIMRNKENASFFDYVIDMKYTEVAVEVASHDRWEEVLQYPSVAYGSYILGLIQHLPAVCITVLDRCQVPSADDPRSSIFYITYNFKYLEPDYVSTPATKINLHVEDHCPMVSLCAMVKNNRVECLSHPVCISFLSVKWHRYGMWICTAYMLVYIVFLAALTGFVVSETSLKKRDFDNLTSLDAQYLRSDVSKRGYSVFATMCIWIAAIYSSINILKEFGKMYVQRFKYFLGLINYLELALYINTLVFVIPMLSGLSEQWETGAVAVFLGWFNALVLLQSYDFFGIYVVMFLEILRTLLQVLIIFSVLIIAFGLAFYMLLYNQRSQANSTPVLSILRTFMMMLELDYIQSFNDEYVDEKTDTLPYGNLTLAFLVVFVLLMPILLINLLIGLAVGDIESVQRDARLKRLAMKVELHIDIERKMPLLVRRHAKLTKHKDFPNKRMPVLTHIFELFTKTKTDSHKINYTDTTQAADMLQEMLKQKVRMRDISTTLEKNNQLLRKIMDKLEIYTEEEGWDEGGEFSTDDSDNESKNRPKRLRKRSPEDASFFKSAVISLWKGKKK